MAFAVECMEGVRMSRSQTNQALSLVWYVMPALWVAVAIAGYAAMADDPAWFGPRTEAAHPAAPTGARRADPPSAAPGPLAAADHDREFLHALGLFREARWAAAYGRLSFLADEGHDEAARIALFMLRHGNDLFGSAWSASEDQVDAWIHAAARPARRRDLSGGD